jgi:AmmeMemoRadiSam system protein B
VIVRRPAVAGSFYPAQPDRLRQEVVELLADADTAPKIIPKALIAPHAGYIYSGSPAATAFATLRDAGRGFLRAPELPRQSLTS